jgi:hypothetical protein
METGHGGSQSAEYVMTVEGGRVNVELHGHEPGHSVTYKKGCGSTDSEGEIAAEFDGEHGWYWRNRDSSDAIVTVPLRGEYSGLREDG